MLYSPEEDWADRQSRWIGKIVPARIGQIDKDIQEAVKLLKTGGVVVFPTDTLYGLGADVFSVSALERVFFIKGRPLGLALPVLVNCWEQVKLAARYTEVGAKLAERFWPGPLTLVLPKRDHLPGLVTGWKNTVAVRMPDHRVPLALSRDLGGPITGTSANLSGAPDLLTLETLQAQLGEQVDYIIRTGPAPNGTASTVVDVTEETPRLVRPGAISLESIRAALE
jgi:L-threonylcarbamoyladenylate synthase